jgi:hypothetical protein
MTKLTHSAPVLAASIAFAVIAACAAVPAITKTIVDEITCVEGEISNGDDTFEGIALACGAVTVEDVGLIVGSLAASKHPLAEKAKAVHHVANGEQPKPALPATSTP